MYRLLITNIRQIVQITNDPDVSFVTGDNMKDVKVLEDPNCKLAILIDSSGYIAALGDFDKIKSVLAGKSVETTVDAQGGVILPGFVDGHSHPVFGGDRVHEFAWKLEGKPYLEIQAAGGGITFTTTHTRQASEDDLLKDFKKIANDMLTAGTTTLEAKSGYGLTTESEIKMMRVLDRGNDELPLEISGTFCGAHMVPKDKDEETQTEIVCRDMIEAIVKEKQDGRLKCVENIDVFCEKNVFNVANTERILKAGREIGLHANFHAEELNYLGGVEMGARVGARAMSHLEEISDQGVKAMAESGSVAVVLPSTAFVLRLTPPPVRKMIDEGVIVALGSDFNPNAWCFAMPAIMHLACVTCKMSVQEALIAATINSAHSIGRARSHGALSKGRVGDVVILNTPKWEHIVYRFAAHQSIITHVIKAGNVVYEKKY